MNPLASPLLGPIVALVLFATVRADPGLGDLTTPEDTPILNLPVSFAAPGLSNPVVTVTTSSTNFFLLPPGSVVVAGHGLDRTVSFYPGADQSGRVTITLHAAEPRTGVTFNNTFNLTVEPVNDPPVISPIPDQLWFFGAKPPPIDVIVQDPEGTVPRVTVRYLHGTLLQPFTPVIQQISDRGVRVYRLLFPGNELPAGTATYEVAATDGVATNHAAFNIVIQPRLLATGAETPGILQVGIGSSSLDLADTDGDGYPELVLPGIPGSTPPQVVKNVRGRFSGGAIVSQVNFPEAVWDDFDGDGKIDCVTLDVPHGRLEFWHSNPLTPFGNTFVLGSSNSIPLTLGAVAFSGDFDGDGDRDLIVVNPVGIESNPGVFLARNAGDGTFDIERLMDGVPGAVAAIGDVDDDGDLDLIVAESVKDSQAPARTTAAIWLNDGHGRFERSAMTLPLGRFVALGLVDVNGDGRPDLWLAEQIGSASSPSATNRLAILPWTPGGFQESWSLTTPNNLGGTVTALFSDFDSDGSPDLVTYGQVHGQAGWFLFHNDGEGRFSPQSYLTPAQNSPRPHAADLNGDSRPDVILGGGNGSLMGQYFVNVFPSFNVPPSAPANLRTRLDGTELTLNWAESTDLFQSGALTYNVRAGFKPGGNDLAPSLALPTGYRLVSRPGNAGHRHTVSIDLSQREGEVIFWTVQAVDAGGQGGPFAEEETLITRLPGIPPVITGLHDVTFKEDAFETIPFTVQDNVSPPSDIRVSVTVDSPDLFLSFAADRTNTLQRTLVGRPRPDANGTAIVTVIATDLGGNSATNQFRLTITPVNDFPRITSPPDQFAFAGEPLPPIRLVVSDPESPLADLTFQFQSSAEDVLPSDSLRIRIVGTNLVELTAPNSQPTFGSTQVTLSATDPDGAMSSRAFRITFQPRVLPELTSFPAPDGTHQPALGDYDGDGRQDLLALGSGRLLLWHNEGAGAWPLQQLPWYTDYNPTYVRWTDWDHDGHLDIAGIGNGPAFADGRPTIFVLLNRPGGWSLGPVLDPLGPQSQLSTLADVDDNGELDAVGTLTAFRHGAAFDPPQPIGVSFQGAIALDLNLDGRTDLVGSNGGFGYLHQDPDLSWNQTPLGWNTSGPADFNDLDRDGKWDALVQFPNRPGLQFRPALGSAEAKGTVPFALSSAYCLTDLDGDGFTDALSASLSDGRLVWRRGLGGDWGEQHLLLPDVVRACTTGDVDGDGRPDVVALVTAQDGHSPDAIRVVVLGNRLSDPAPTPPAPPLGLGVVLEADGAFLEWTPGPGHVERGVTYNIRVGTTPGAGDVITPESTSSGWRTVSAPGNAGISHRRRISGLVNGRTYYGAVQAVDAGGNGGPFSDEVSFVSRPRVIILSGPDSVVTTVDEPQVTVPVSITGAEGVISYTATMIPALLAADGGPRLSVDSNTNLLIRIPFRRWFWGTGVLTVEVTDSGHVRGRVRIPVRHGDAGDGADLAYRRTFTLAPGEPLVLPFFAIDPRKEWSLSSFILPNPGFIQGDFPDLTYTSFPGVSGSDRVAAHLITPDQTRVLAEFIIGFSGTGSTHASVRPDGKVDLVLQGMPGELGSVEISSDLVNWRELTRYQVPDSGFFTFDGLTTVGAGPQAFIRLRPDKP